MRLWGCGVRGRGTYGRGVLLLVVQPGAAPLLAVAVLLQGVEHLVGQFQVHPQTVAHVHLRSKLPEGGGTQGGDRWGTGQREKESHTRVRVLQGQTYVVHASRVLATTHHLVVFGGDVLALPREAPPGRRLRFVYTHRQVTVVMS